MDPITIGLFALIAVLLVLYALDVTRRAWS